MSGLFIFIALWTAIYGYMILASIDFGAGFYLFWGLTKKKALFETMNEYLSPLSELINISYILFFAVVCGFFSDWMFMYQQALAIPGIVAIGLVLVKGTFFAISELAQPQTKWYTIGIAGSGIVGMLIPLALCATLVVSEGGFLQADLSHLPSFLGQLLGSFYFWTVMIIAIVSILYISAVFFVGFAHICGKEALSDRMRNFALFWSMPTVIASGLSFLGLERQNSEHFAQALNHYWMFLLSLVCLLAAVTLVFLKRALRLSFACVMMQYYFALMGYTQSHLPYVITPNVRIPDQLERTVDSQLFSFLMLPLALLFVTVVLYVKERTARESDQFKRSAG
ncbi:MAG: cytochrome d ubiquinol oxidase subunit II [Sporolactobacillus sp.]